MKTAEEWARICYPEKESIESVIKQAQADALRHAADIVIADWAIRGDDCAVRNSVRFIRTLAATLNQ